MNTLNEIITVIQADAIDVPVWEILIMLLFAAVFMLTRG